VTDNPCTRCGACCASFRVDFARDELDVLELINGRNSVKDIARRTRTGTFAVSRIVYRLAKSNVVRRRVTPVTV
jgi:Fe-S-cluster containining protein